MWCFYPETTGLSLEAIDLLFIPDDEDCPDVQADERVYCKLQWRVVSKAWDAVKRNKADRKAGVDAEVANTKVSEHGKDVEHIRLENVS